MSITLAISGQPPFVVDVETLTIGSDPAETIALTGDERVKPRHAVIRRVAGRWLVEAREGESIQVGNARPARVHWLSPGDVIRLTENGPEIAFQPPSARPASPAGPVPPAAKVTPAAAAPQVAPASHPQPAPPPLAPDPFTMEPVELASLKAAVPSDERLRVKPLPAPGERKPADSAAPPQTKISPALKFAAGVGAVGVVAAAVWMIGFGRKGGDDYKPRQARPEAGSEERPVVKKWKKKTEEPDAVTVAAKPPEKGIRPPEPLPQPPSRKTSTASPEPASLTDPQRFLYAVLVQDAAGEQQFRLGTAWAVSPRRLVTSGAVVLAIEELQKSGLTAKVSPAKGAARIKITGLRVHPGYRQAFQDAAAAREQLETARAARTSSKQRKPTGNSPDGDIESARSRLDRAYAAQAQCDVGVLNVDQPLLHLLTPSFTMPVGAGERLRLAGLPFPVDDYRAPEAEPADRVEQFTFNVAAGDRDASQLTLDFEGELARRNWSGSPILNSSGNVVGIYSRPLAGRDDDKSDDEGRVTHAVTPVARLREIAPDLQ
ncbi:MAG: FHA domain-containing protein [Deltaproteobacteria bacterium]